MGANLESRVARVESDVAVLRAHADESGRTSSAILDKLSAMQEEFRASHEELRTGQVELISRMTVVEKSVGNLERSAKRIEGDVGELKAGHIELRNIVASLVK